MKAKKVAEAFFVVIATFLGSFLIGNLFFRIILDVLVVPITGMRPVIAAVNMTVFMVLGYKLVDSRYHFEEKEKLFKDFKLFSKK